MNLRWLPTHALTVVMAAQGYPGSYATGSEIRGLEALAASRTCSCSMPARGATVTAGWSPTGGRVLDVTGLGASLAEARARAYAAVDRIDWPEGFCRRDIGWRALGLPALPASL